MTDRRPTYRPPSLPRPNAARSDLVVGGAVLTDRGDDKVPVAVALKHESGDLPKVVASGRGSLAEKILQIAFASGVQVREDRDLVELLAALPIEAPIPEAAFEAVAEILRYLYQFNRDPGGIASGARR